MKHYYEFDTVSDLDDIIDDIKNCRIENVDLRITSIKNGVVTISGEGITFSMSDSSFTQRENSDIVKNDEHTEKLILIEIDENLDPSSLFTKVEEYYKANIIFLGG